ncbi:MAG: hypothetical protein EXR79_16630 [Myxococcales bacterium]|nr:hypothetical protein [Myxococcales bacterium]
MSSLPNRPVDLPVHPFGRAFAATLATWLAGAALPGAALAATLPVEGGLRGVAGGPVADGSYVMVAALYDAADAPKPVWEEVVNQVAVTGGGFAVTLGLKNAIPDALLASGQPLWFGVQVGADKELPRVAITAVPRAWHAKVAAAGAFGYAASDAPGGKATGLQCTGCVDGAAIAVGAVDAKHVAFAFAGSQTKGGPATTALQAKVADSAASADDLACSGCIGPAHLSPATKGLFLSANGGAVAGAVSISKGLDLKDSTLQGANLAAGVVANSPCTAGQRGQLQVDEATGTLHFCNGAAWQKVKLCTGKCKAAVEVACAQPIPDGCGDLTGCKGAGVLCEAGKTCIGTACVGALGEDPANPATSCKDLLKKTPALAGKDGLWWLDPDGAGGVAPFQAWCDMTTDGGGWTLVGTVAGGDANQWTTQLGYWADEKPLGAVTSPWQDFKSPAWWTLDTTNAEVLWQRRYNKVVQGKVKLSNACLFKKKVFRELFATWDTALQCGIGQLTVVQQPQDGSGLSDASYREGSANGLAGKDTNGWCWNGGDTDTNTFKGHAGWNQIGYTCHAAGHLGYIGLFESGNAQFSKTDIDTTNWLVGADTTKTEVSFFVR